MEIGVNSRLLPFLTPGIQFGLLQHASQNAQHPEERWELGGDTLPTSGVIGRQLGQRGALGFSDYSHHGDRQKVGMVRIH